MFDTARLKLSVVFLVVLLLVSGVFSAVIYTQVTSEITKGYEMAEGRIVSSSAYNPSRKAIALTLLAHDLEVAKDSVLLRLIFINIALLLSGFCAAYFLAGRAIAPLNEALLRQKRFVSDASHEIKTPLTVIKSEIEVALLDGSSSKKELTEVLESTLHEIQKIENLTNQFLALSRLENKNIKVKSEKTNLNDLAHEVVATFNKIAKKEKIDLILDLDKANDFYVKTDKVLLAQVISIILENAIKYTPEGGKVYIKTQKGRVATISIKDTGVGIPKESMPYIFDRLYQAETSRSFTRKKGYGLGLSIAKSLSELLNISIYAKSKEGVGTTFTLCFKTPNSKS